MTTKSRALNIAGVGYEREGTDSKRSAGVIDLWNHLGYIARRNRGKGF